MLKDEILNNYNLIVNQYLRNNNIYLNNWKGFDTSSLYKQQRILTTIYILIKGIGLYLNKYEYVIKNIPDYYLNECINEAVKLLKLFKTYYEEV